MKKQWLVLLGFAVALCACNGSIQSGESVKKVGGDVVEQPKSVPHAGNKKLLFVYSISGAGLMGYFNDSSISVCPGCDPCTQNFETLYTIESMGKYSMGNDCLITHIGDRVDTVAYKRNGKVIPDWIMVDGNWLIPPQNCK